MATSKAAANANNIENTKVEGTIVLSKEDKEFRASEVKRLFSEITTSKKATLKDKLELAKYLLQVKRELKNDFYTYITEDVMGRKQVGRHIKLILTLESVKNFPKGMSHKNKEADKIEENLSLLVEDERVVSLTAEQIETMAEPTMATITRAKETETDEDFLKAIAGDKDVLKALQDKRSSASKAQKAADKANEEKELAEKKPKNMDSAIYESLLKKDKPTLISILQDQFDEHKKISDEITTLADKGNLANLKQYLKNVDLYIPSKHKNEEEA